MKTNSPLGFPFLSYLNFVGLRTSTSRSSCVVQGAVRICLDILTANIKSVPHCIMFVSDSSVQPTTKVDIDPHLAIRPYYRVLLTSQVA